MSTGTVVRYDRTRGYGFITPDEGGEDVFLHAKTLEGGDEGIFSGTRVRFDVIADGRGLKAVGVQVLRDGRRPATSSAGAALPGNRSTADSQDDTCEVLSEADFVRNVTEVVIASAPTVTGAQIVAIRNGLLRLARSNRWVD
jgi:cold shock CspA family protein